MFVNSIFKIFKIFYLVIISQKESTPYAWYSVKSITQLYSPTASDIATQLYSAYAEWYSLREFLGE